jgi:hypothetical protein
MLNTALPTLLALMAFVRPANAQSPELQQRVADVKEAMAKNKQALAAYSWLETVTISLKGEEKKQEHFQVRLGPDFKPEKTSLDPPPEPPSGGRLKRHVVAKKTEEYKDYADQMKALAAAICTTGQRAPAAGLCAREHHLGSVRGRPQ